MKQFSRLMAKLGFLFAGSDCRMPHIVQVLSMFLSWLIFWELWRSYNCRSDYEQNYFLRYKHLFFKHLGKMSLVVFHVIKVRTCE